MAAAEAKTTAAVTTHAAVRIPTDQKASDCPPVADGDGTDQASAADTKTQTSQNQVHTYIINCTYTYIS